MTWDARHEPFCVWVAEFWICRAWRSGLDRKGPVEERARALGAPVERWLYTKNHKNMIDTCACTCTYPVTSVTPVQGANHGKWKGALAKAKSIQRREYRAAAKARVAKAHAHARATA